MNGPNNEFEELSRREEPDQFEAQLMRAMKHADPPAGFADTLMQRAAREERPVARVLPMPARWRTLQMWAAGAVAATVIGAVGVQQMHHRQERAEATRQFEIATQIEQQALDRTRAKLSRSGISLDAQ